MRNQPKRPNIVVILTDDLATDISERLDMGNIRDTCKK